MNFVNQAFLLPPFITDKLSSELVDAYFERLPRATNITVQILSDNAEFDPEAPFSHNTLISATQKLINSPELNKDTLENVLGVLSYIDFKYALIFFVELNETYSYEYLYSCLAKLNDTVFTQRLNTFLSVLAPEFLCIDNPTSLL